MSAWVGGGGKGPCTGGGTVSPTGRPLPPRPPSRCQLACVDQRLKRLAATPSLLRRLDAKLSPSSVARIRGVFSWLADVAS